MKSSFKLFQVKYSDMDRKNFLLCFDKSRYNDRLALNKRFKHNFVGFEVSNFSADLFCYFTLTDIEENKLLSMLNFGISNFG